MKRLLLVLLVLTFVGCSKNEEEKPQPMVQQTVSVPSILSQEINGTVSTDYSYNIKIYEDMGSGNFQETISNEYKLNSFPFVYEDEIKRPFYFEIVLHNSSVYSNGGKGDVSVTVKYKGANIVVIEADENTWSENYTSTVYNN